MKTKPEDMTRPPADKPPPLTPEQKAYYAAKKRALEEALQVGFDQLDRGEFSYATAEEIIAEARARRAKKKQAR